MTKKSLLIYLYIFMCSHPFHGWLKQGNGLLISSSTESVNFTNCQSEEEYVIR